MHYTNLWKFQTEQFTFKLCAAVDDYPDTSWMDEEALEEARRGNVTCFCFRVQVIHAGRILGSDYLGESWYADPEEFYTAHWNSPREYRNTLDKKAARLIVCHYFPEMVRNAIKEAREYVADFPTMRAA